MRCLFLVFTSSGDQTAARWCEKLLECKMKKKKKIDIWLPSLRVSRRIKK